MVLSECGCELRCRESGNSEEHIDRAIAMEPNNMEYKQMKQRMQGGSNWYVQRGMGYGMPDVRSDNWCMDMCLLNLLCNCCTGLVDNEI